MSSDNRSAPAAAKNKKKTNRKRKNAVSTAGAVFISILAIIVFTGVIVVGYVGINLLTFINGDAAITLSSIKSSLNQTTFLYATDSKGETVELTRLHGAENRIWVDLENIPENMQNAFVALEDKRFYEHSGVDWVRTIGVFLKNNSQGGSTITQQLIKNITIIPLLHKRKVQIMTLADCLHFSLCKAYISTKRLRAKHSKLFKII